MPGKISLPIRPDHYGSGKYRVRFIDYDGTILKTIYTNKNGSVLPPANPIHSGLTFQEWNNSYTGITQDTDIGAVYTTSDGKTRFDIVITPSVSSTINIYLTKSDTSTMTVEWGDGNQSTSSASGNVSFAKTYSATGNYTIKIWISSGSGTYTLAQSATSLFGNGSTNISYRIVKAFIGNNVTSIMSNAFAYCYSLENITISKSVTSISSSCFSLCVKNTCIIIPSSITSVVGTTHFSGNYSAVYAIVSKEVSSLTGYFFNNSISLTSIAIPEGITALGSYFLNADYTLKKITLPGSLTSIGSLAFNSLFTCTEIIINATTPPTIASDTFSGLNNICRIKVPVGTLSSYQSATNWNTLINYLEEQQ